MAKLVDQNQTKTPLRLVSVAEDLIPLENQEVFRKFLASLEAMTSYLNRSCVPAQDFLTLPRRQPKKWML